MCKRQEGVACHRSNGNYKAFAQAKRQKKSADASAYLVGSGLASLAAAAFMIRDGRVDGKQIHILEELPIAGGSLDGIYKQKYGFVIRGDREMESHFECLWDLFRSSPSLEVENASVFYEFYWLNKEDSNSSHCRIIYNQGKQWSSDGELTLSGKAIKEILALCLMKESQLQDIKITDVFSDEFFESNFWTYWCTMFAFEPWTVAFSNGNATLLNAIYSSH